MGKNFPRCADFTPFQSQQTSLYEEIKKLPDKTFFSRRLMKTTIAKQFRLFRLSGEDKLAANLNSLLQIFNISF